jgi:hypothetical protein
MPLRNPSIEENTYRQRGSKLVFDGVELPGVRRISSRQARSGGDKDESGADGNMIENGSNSSATGCSDLLTLESEKLFAHESRGTSPLAHCIVV